MRQFQVTHLMPRLQMDTTGATVATDADSSEGHHYTPSQQEIIAQIPPELLEESDGDYGDVEDEDLTGTEAGDEGDSDEDEDEEEASDYNSSSDEDGGSEDSDSSSDLQVR